MTENSVLKEEVKFVKRENKLLQTQLDLRDEKITKLELQIFDLAQTKCKDQPATAHKAKFRKMSHQKVSQHSSCSDSDSDSESSACFSSSSSSAMSDESTPKKIQRPSKHRQSRPATN